MTYSQAMTASRTTRNTSSKGIKRGQNTTVFQSSKASIGPVSNIIILVIIVCLLGVLYLTQVTKTYALGYKINDLTSQQGELRDEKDRLELESVKLQSIERVKSSQAAARMTPVTPSNYAQ